MTRYPLTWPAGQPRVADHRRRDAELKLDFERARKELLRELGLLGTRNVILSTNVPVRLDGVPYAGMAEPKDPGVAVYFDRQVRAEWKPFVIACDTYRKLRWNTRAIGVTVEALRSIHRHGASSMLEQAFTGFAALPPKSEPWWNVLGISEDSPVEDIRQAHRKLAAMHHPDRGGAPARMVEINAAFERAMEARS